MVDETDRLVVLALLQIAFLGKATCNLSSQERLDARNKTKTEQNKKRRNTILSFTEHDIHFYRVICSALLTGKPDVTQGSAGDQRSLGGKGCDSTDHTPAGLVL